MGPVAVAAALAVAAAGCGSSRSPGAVVTLPATAAPTTVAPPTTLAVPRTTVPRTPPTTAAWTASAPRPSPDAAAAALVSEWTAANRPLALTVASPPAVSTLFAVPYPAGAAISRGCTVAFPPIVCTYGPPGGASATDALFELYVAQSPAGWYVSSVLIRH
jgi:hypothetical protein